MKTIGSLIKSTMRGAGEMIGNISDGLQVTAEQTLRDARDIAVDITAKTVAVTYELGHNALEAVSESADKLVEKTKLENSTARKDLDKLEKSLSDAYSFVKEKVGEVSDSVQKSAKPAIRKARRNTTKLVNKVTNASS